MGGLVSQLDGLVVCTRLSRLRADRGLPASRQEQLRGSHKFSYGPSSSPHARRRLLCVITDDSSGPELTHLSRFADYSEATSLEADWQTAFFGANYPELLAIKQKYDPNNIFNVWKGVGWTGPSDPAYRCYANN